jgi:hypothetical protein
VLLCKLPKAAPAYLSKGEPLPKFLHILGIADGTLKQWTSSSLMVRHATNPETLTEHVKQDFE